MTDPGSRAVPLPPAALRFMKEDDAALVRLGREMAGQLVERGMAARSAVLDVGCGYGRLAIGILGTMQFEGRYLGFDILPKQIAWCRSELAARWPNMDFRRIDIRNERYNPQGTIGATTVRFPVASGTIDVCATFSVYTHLFRPAIERYLHETRRALKAGGVAVTTWLLFDDERLPAVRSEKATYPMRHVLDDDTLCMVEAEPLRAIAYRESTVRAMVGLAGLEVLAIERGSWAGEPAASFQDVVVLRRPMGASDRAGRQDRLVHLLTGVAQQAQSTDAGRNVVHAWRRIGRGRRPG